MMQHLSRGATSSSQLSVTNDINGDACITRMYIGRHRIDGPAAKERQPDVVGVGGPGILRK